MIKERTLALRQHRASLRLITISIYGDGPLPSLSPSSILHHILPTPTPSSLPPPPKIPTLPPLTPPQPHRLPILLQFRNQPVPHLDHVGILAVLVVRPVGLDDLVDAVDGAGDAVCGDEFGEIAGGVSFG